MYVTVSTFKWVMSIVIASSRGVIWGGGWGAVPPKEKEKKKIKEKRERKEKKKRKKEEGNYE